MILDKAMELSDAQLFTASAASTNQIDLGPNTCAKNSVGAEGVASLLISVAESGAGAGDVTFQMRSSANADMSGAVIHEQSRAILATELATGSRVPYHPNIPFDAGQFVDIYMLVNGSISAGKVSIHGVAARQTNI